MYRQMSWRYIASRDRENGVDAWGIREVYEFEGEHGGINWTSATVDPFGNTFGELKHDLEAMLAGMGSGGFLDLTLDPPQIVRLTPGM